jgi:dTDP-4-dehydrorhamnose reductase
MLRLAAERETVSVVTDQIGQPTWTREVARATRRLVDAEAPGGIYHATASGRASWFEFARALFSEVGLDPDRIVPTDAAAFPRPAPRPAFSVLGHAAWGVVGLPEPADWRQALADAVSQGVFLGR